MKRSIKLAQFLGFAVVSLGGTILHFLYEWLGKAVWIAPLSGVNESTWEHMKLLFWPAFIYAIAQSFYFKDRKDFWCVKLRGILLGLILIPVIFYTYNGAVGRSPDWLNIAIFFVAAAAAFIYEARLFQAEQPRCRSPKGALAVLVGIAVLFVVFTFATPEIGIFRDPLSGTYGM
jgi:cell division protein FtsW (lipid II flippase)